MKKLSSKQKKFCEEYLVDLNATQAAIRAGYSQKTAKEIGCQNLTKLNIIEEISKQKQKLSDKTAITVENIVLSIKEIHDTAKEADDLNNALKGADMLMKYLGGYEKDNKQEVSMTIKSSLKDFYKDINENDWIST